MSDAVGPDELALEATLEVLEAPLAELEAVMLGADEATAALRRQQLEALTLLAWSLPAEPVSPRQRDQLLGRLQGDETVLVAQLRRDPAATGPVAPPSPQGVLDPPPAPVPRGEGVPPAAARPRRPAPVVVPSRRVRSYRWALPLAALFAVGAIGLALHDLRLGDELGRSRELLAAVREEQQQLEAKLRAAEGAASSAAVATQLREAQSQLALVTSTGTLVCPLRPSTGGSAREAGGMLYVADDHQHWYLRAQKLPPPGEGRVYRLWFLVGDRPVAAATFELVGDEAILASPTMPSGTSAALVTVEPVAGAGERPGGPVVLYGKRIAPMV